MCYSDTQSKDYRDRWQSGLTRLSWKQESEQSDREFESHPIRSYENVSTKKLVGHFCWADRSKANFLACGEIRMVAVIFF